MKKIIITMMLILIFFTEAAYAASVKIGVIDTGIKEREGIFDIQKILNGKNYVLENDDTDDTVGHGTRIASLILGTVDGELNSPCRESWIVPLVYYTKLASGSVLNGGIEAICNAIYDAVDVYGCKIINISSGVAADDEQLEKAVDYAEENGVLIVSACGNSGSCVYYPAAYNTVIGVGSHNDRYEPSDFSCQGNGIDILMCGENLKVASIKNAADYEVISGTSYAAALITAHAAAALEQYPYIMPSQMRYLMRISCDDICDIGYDEKSGYGIFVPEYFYENIRLFGNGKIVCFDDVNTNHWFFESVRYAEENGLFSGVTETTFEPYRPITREMFVTVLWRAENKPVVDYHMTFKDVDETAYYGEAVRWAASQQLVNGYTETEFEPKKPITREEMAAIIHFYADYKGKETTQTGNLSQFTDQSHISNWAREHVSWAVGTGLFSGKGDGILDPQGITTRAEAASVLQRFFEQKLYN